MLKRATESNNWSLPVINANSRDELGEIIQQGDPLVNFKYKNIPTYESSQGRFWPEAALTEKGGVGAKSQGVFNRLRGTKPLFVAGREVTQKSVRRYTAKLRGTGMIGKRATGPRWHLDRQRYKPQIDQAIQEGFKLDLTVYQERLSDPNESVQEEAIKELNILKELLQDAKTMREEDLQRKYTRSVWVGRIAMAIGFGAAAGSAAFNLDMFADLHQAVLDHGGDLAVKAFEKSVNSPNVAIAIAQGAEHFNTALTAGETAHQAADLFKRKVGVPESMKSISQRFSISNLLTKPSSRLVSSITPKIQEPTRQKLKSAVNIAIPLTLLVLTSLSGPGIVITAIAVTTTLTKIAANVKQKEYKDKLEQVELNGASLLATIDKMIEHHGQIWKTETSGLFAEQKSVKNRLNSGLNAGLDTPENLLAAIPNEEQESARSMLEGMIQNAANTNYNTIFNAELQKGLKMGNLNLGAAHAMRNRRMKLRSLGQARAASQVAAPTQLLKNAGPLNLMNELGSDPVPDVYENREENPNVPSRSTTPMFNNISPPSPTAMRRRRGRKTRRRHS